MVNYGYNYGDIYGTVLWHGIYDTWWWLVMLLDGEMTGSTGNDGWWTGNDLCFTEAKVGNCNFQ